MALIYNRAEIPAWGHILYGGKEVSNVIYNGKTVWQKIPEVWVMKIGLVGTWSATCSSSHGWGTHKDSGEEGYYAKLHYVRIRGTCTCDLKMNATIPNLALPVNQYSSSGNLSSGSVKIGEDGNIVIDTTYKGSFPYDTGIGDTGSSISETWTNSSSGTFDIPGFSTKVTMNLTTSGWARASGGGWWPPDQASGPDPFTDSGGISSQTASAVIDITVDNLGQWAKATVSGGKLTVNGTTISDTTDTVFAAGESIKISGTVTETAKDTEQVLMITLKS